MSQTELDDFKKYINLPSVAESLGFTLIKSKSSISTVVMKHPSSNDNFHFFTNAQTKDQLFRNIHNESQKGTVIDLYQLIKPGTNLGNVRKALRPYLNQPATKRQYNLKASYLDIKPDNTINFFKVQKLSNTNFLNSRGITNDTLFSQKFRSTIGQVNVHSTKYHKTFENTAFPIKNSSGIIGLDVRNKSKEGSFKHAAAGSKRSLGLWTSNIPTKTDTILISESPIDALSHYQQNPKDNQNTFYISTNGTPSIEHIKLINKSVEKLKPKRIALGNDNDNAGTRFNINYLSELNKFKNPSPKETKEWTLKLKGKNFVELDIHIDIKPTFDSQNTQKDHTNYFKTNVDQINQDAEPSQIISYEKPLKLQVVQDNTHQKHYNIKLRNNKQTLKNLQGLMKDFSDNPHVQLDIPMDKDFNQDLLNQNAHKVNKHINHSKSKKAQAIEF